MVSSASSRCPHIFMLNEKTVFCSNPMACSIASGVFFCSSSDAWTSSGRMATNHVTFLIEG